MRFASFKIRDSASWGLISDQGLHPVGSDFRSRYPSLKAALTASALDQAAESARSNAPLAAGEFRYARPIGSPDKIVCVGMNYLEHIREMGRTPPEYPALFIRFPLSLNSHDEPIIRPRASTHYDFEGELAFVIGKKARHVKAENAFEYIAGYSCFMDGSVRDYQRQTSQFTAGKNFPGSGAFGPWLVTTDEVPDPDQLVLETRISGELMQHKSIGDLCIKIPEMLEYISTITELAPGDVIATGTPSGVGAARTPPRWLIPGDTVEVSIDGVGTLRNTVVDE